MGDPFDRLWTGLLNNFVYSIAYVRHWNASSTPDPTSRELVSRGCQPAAAFARTRPRSERATGTYPPECVIPDFRNISAVPPGLWNAAVGGMEGVNLTGPLSSKALARLSLPVASP